MTRNAAVPYEEPLDFFLSICFKKYHQVYSSWKEMLPAFVANLQSHVLPNRRKHVMSPCSNCWKISWTTQPRFPGEMGGWCVELRGGGTIRKRIVYSFYELCMFRMFWYVLAIFGAPWTKTQWILHDFATIVSKQIPNTRGCAVYCDVQRSGKNRLKSSPFHLQVSIFHYRFVLGGNCFSTISCHV